MIDPPAGFPHLLGFDWQEHVFPWSSANSICVQQTRPSLRKGLSWMTWQTLWQKLSLFSTPLWIINKTALWGPGKVEMVLWVSQMLRFNILLIRSISGFPATLDQGSSAVDLRWGRCSLLQPYLAHFTPLCWWPRLHGYLSLSSLSWWEWASQGLLFYAQVQGDRSPHLRLLSQEESTHLIHTLRAAES